MWFSPPYSKFTNKLIQHWMRKVLLRIIRWSSSVTDAVTWSSITCTVRRITWCTWESKIGEDGEVHNCSWGWAWGLAWFTVQVVDIHATAPVADKVHQITLESYFLLCSIFLSAFCKVTITCPDFIKPLNEVTWYIILQL